MKESTALDSEVTPVGVEAPVETLPKELCTCSSFPRVRPEVCVSVRPRNVEVGVLLCSARVPADVPLPNWNWVSEGAWLVEVPLVTLVACEELRI